MTDAATIAPGLREQVRQTGGHVADAGRAAYGAAKTGLGQANEVARAGVEKSIAAVKADGFWKSIANGARKQPLVAGAALVTAGYVASKAIAGPRQQDVQLQRIAAQSQGRSL